MAKWHQNGTKTLTKIDQKGTKWNKNGLQMDQISLKMQQKLDKMDKNKPKNGFTLKCTKYKP